MLHPLRILLPFMTLSILMTDSRLLPLTGAENFRDLGGYPTAHGRHVRWGVLYRAGHLHHLTSEDTKQLEGLKISRIIDFRGPSETSDKPDRIPEGATYVSHPVDVAGADLKERIREVLKGKVEMDLSDYLMGVNIEFASNYTPVFGEWLLDLARSPDASPQVFHCTAGKDRTGFAAAILLRTLGVPAETVMADYMKTNTYIAGTIDKIIRKVRTRSLFRNDGEVLRPLLGVEERYLENAFSTIDKDWGDFDTYLRDGLGLNSTDVESLRNRFLE